MEASLREKNSRQLRGADEPTGPRYATEGIERSLWCLRPAPMTDSRCHIFTGMAERPTGLTRMFNWLLNLLNPPGIARPPL